MKKELIVLMLCLSSMVFISCGKSTEPKKESDNKAPTETVQKEDANKDDEDGKKEQSDDEKIKTAEQVILDKVDFGNYKTELKYVDEKTESGKNLLKYKDEYYVFMVRVISEEGDSKYIQNAYAVKKETSDVYVVWPVNGGGTEIMTYEEFLGR